MNEPGEREVAIFGAVLQLPAGQRASYLDQVCASDGALRERVEAFLSSHLEAGAFLEEPAPGARGVVPSFPGVGEDTLHRVTLPSEKAGDRIGRYKLLQQIGEGGCGVGLYGGARGASPAQGRPQSHPAGHGYQKCHHPV